jgi:hypothetical protein
LNRDVGPKLIRAFIISFAGGISLSGNHKGFRANGTKYLYREDFFAQRRKGAKRYRVSKGFSLLLCAFAPLREKYFSFPDSISDFSRKAS